MGILKKITDEYFGDEIREDEKINVSDLDVEIVSFTDNNGDFHKHGYRVKNFKSDAKKIKALNKLIERIIENRGLTCSLNDIDVSNITTMTYSNRNHYVGLFEKSPFDGDVSGWDVSNVTDMSFMFRDSSFSGENGIFRLEKENKVVILRSMFYSARFFNADISDWDVSNVENMEFMFYKSENFKFDLSKWKVREDCNMRAMFTFSPLQNNTPDWVDGNSPDYFRKK